MYPKWNCSWFTQGVASLYPGCNWALSMRAVSAKALNILLLSTLLRFAFPFSRRPLVQRDKRKSWVKWQPAFRLVKVVFVVVNRQHRVHNQTVVPVVSVVVKTKARQLQTWTSELGYSIFVHQTVHPKTSHKPDFANALQSYHLTRWLTLSCTPATTRELYYETRKIRFDAPFFDFRDASLSVWQCKIV